MNEHRWWLTAASWVILGWLAAHVVGNSMTLMFERQVGFYPVWFLDCIACSGPQVSLPYGPTVIGGVSVAGLAAGLTAIYLVAVRLTPYDTASAVAGVALLATSLFHVTVTWAFRFPGSPPSVIASVGIPAVAALLAAAGLFAATGSAGLSRAAADLRRRATGLACLASGVVGVVMLGGLVAVASGVLCGWHIARSKCRAERMLAMAGMALAVVGMLVRVRVRMRFPGTLDLL